MTDEDRGPGLNEPDDELQTGERGTTRRNLVIGGGTAVVAAAAAGIAIAGCGGGDDDTSANAGGAGVASTTSTTGSTAGAPAKGSITITVNGRRESVDATPDTPLLYVLRDNLAQKGPKFGCGLAQCGACAVLLDGRQIRSCVTPVSAVTGRQVTTLDGLADTWKGASPAVQGGPQHLHPLQQAWIDEQVPQCGYCQSGMIIQAADLLSSNPNPSDDQIKQAMNGHLCRCGTYNGIVRAIRRAAQEMATA